MVLLTSTRTASASESFEPEPVSARNARRFLQGFLQVRGLEDALLEAAELALSEVVTNAVLHAHTPFEVSLTLGEDGSLRVEVADGNTQRPARRDYAEQATTGRGMELVAACTRDCGVESRGADGKVVWFVVAVAADGAGGSDGARGLRDAWDVTVDHAADRTDEQQGTAVRLLALPPTLWFAAAEHHDAVLRELALYSAEHPRQGTTPMQAALADQARSWVSTPLVAAMDGLTASVVTARTALPSGDPGSSPGRPASYDLELRVPPDAAMAFGALQDVLDTAEQLATDGHLLARPALPEIVAVRDWACEQVISQLGGVRPSAWPGTGQDRFTRQVDDRARPAPPTWDTRTVSESARGAVAADDANRIIAVSSPLASALGWAVEDLVGRRVVVLIPAELREAHVAGFTRHLTTGETHAVGVPLRLPVLHADGSRVECAVHIEQTPVTSGRAVYVAWIEPDAHGQERPQT